MITKGLAARVAEIERLKLMDTQYDPVLDDIAKTAALVLDAPISLLTIVGDTRQWFKASYGIARGESALESSFCGRVVDQRQTLVVLDAPADPLFCANPFVTGEPHICFYVGVPLISSHDISIGALSVIDSAPHRAARDADILLLHKLARLAAYEIERNRADAA